MIEKRCFADKHFSTLSIKRPGHKPQIRSLKSERHDVGLFGARPVGDRTHLLHEDG
jgi:hypothetical protein